MHIVVLKASGVGKGTMAPMPAPTIQWVFRKYLMFTIKYHVSFCSCAKSFFLSVMVLSYLYYLNNLFSGDRRCGNHAGQIWLQTVKQVIWSYDHCFWQIQTNFIWRIVCQTLNVHSFRFKMIKYEADDALAMLRPGEDHLVNVRSF